MILKMPLRPRALAVLALADPTAKAEQARQLLADWRAGHTSIDPATVISNFSYQKLPMVDDLESDIDALAANTLIASISAASLSCIFIFVLSKLWLQLFFLGPRSTVAV